MVLRALEFPKSAQRSSSQMRARGKRQQVRESSRKRQPDRLSTTGKELLKIQLGKCWSSRTEHREGRGERRKAELNQTQDLFPWSRPLHCGLAYGGC